MSQRLLRRYRLQLMGLVSIATSSNWYHKPLEVLSYSEENQPQPAIASCDITDLANDTPHHHEPYEPNPPSQRLESRHAHDPETPPTGRSSSSQEKASFYPDWCFGLLKRAFRRTAVGCLDDIVERSGSAYIRLG